MTIVVLGGDTRLGRVLVDILNYNKRIPSNSIYRINIVDAKVDIDHIFDYLNTIDGKVIVVNCWGDINDTVKLSNVLSKWAADGIGKSILHISSIHTILDTKLDNNNIVVQLDNVFGGVSNYRVFVEDILDKLVSDEYVVVTNRKYTRPMYVYNIATSIVSLLYDRLLHNTEWGNILYPKYDEDKIVTYYQLACEISTRSNICKPICNEDDGCYIIDELPNSINTGNWVIGNSYKWGLQDTIDKYLGGIGWKVKRYTKMK